MVKFKIHSLAFTSCSRRYAITLTSFPLAIFHAAMYLRSAQYTELVNCSFHDNIATALAVNDTNITLAGTTEFIHNRACGNITAGGGIGALSSSLTFTGNTTFLDNSASSGQCPFVYNDVTSVGGGTIIHQAILFSVSVELTTLSTTQPTMVVQFLLHLILQ